MKALLSLLLAALSCATTLATEKVGDRAWSDPNFHLYVVIVAVVIDSDSKLQSFHVAGVADPKTKKRLEVPLPDNYVAAVRKKLSDGKHKPTLEDGKPVEKFAYYYFSPEHPDVVITDLALPLEQQR